jgi:hypothetical protein
MGLFCKASSRRLGALAASLLLNEAREFGLSWFRFSDRKRRLGRRSRRHASVGGRAAHFAGAGATRQKCPTTLGRVVKTK